MILITSGAFISSEFQVELGRLPPAFLPMGNKRLYEHQVAALRSFFPDLDIHLSVTDSYEVPTYDVQRLKSLGVRTIPVPDGLKLGESVLYVINTIGRYDESLRIMHGDTYMCDIPLFEDVVALGDAEDEYPWETETTDGQVDRVWCGYFAFSDIKLLAASLCAWRGSFVEAIRHYQTRRPLQFPLVCDWLDMGHVNTYFRSKAKFTTQRAFNDLRIDRGVVHKASLQSTKIDGEANWFAALPYQLKRHVPQLIRYGVEEGRHFYELEYLPHLSLNELFVHGNLPQVFWRRAFALTDLLLESFRTAVPMTQAQLDRVGQDYRQLIVDKTRQRLANFVAGSGDSLTQSAVLNGRVLPPLNDVVEHCQAAALAVQPRPGVVHGDLCFSNILYDSRANTLKLLDPRGINARQEPASLGDLRYDVAKFTHSVVGLYDHIVAGHFTLTELHPLDFTLEIHLDGSQLQVQQWYHEQVKLLGLPCHEVLPVVVLLFVSMLPLHGENPLRQRALLANALRLFQLWQEN
jgi:hypothetical protein